MFNGINEGGLNQILTRRLGMQGGASAPGVAPELFPILNLESDRPEWGYLKGERICSKDQTVSAVAAEHSVVQFYLPSTSQEIVTIERLVSGTSNFMSVARAVGIGAGIAGWSGQTVATRDFRWNGERTSLIIERTNSAVAPSVFPFICRLTSTNVTLDVPIVIAPGTALIVFTPTVNQALAVTAHWRERPANPGELV